MRSSPAEWAWIPRIELQQLPLLWSSLRCWTSLV